MGRQLINRLVAVCWVLLTLVFLTPDVQTVPLSHYAAEDKAVDELIVNAANSTKEFEFFYDENEKLLKLEYDIVYSYDEWEEENDKSPGRTKRTAAVKIGMKGAKRWTDAKIPYEYASGDFTDKEKDIIASAMKEWSEHTCLNFVKEVDVKNRLLFKDAGGCFSRVGMVGGRQVVGLAEDCRFKSVLLHELGHAIGLHHEQTRPDRDDHVTIVSENIPEPMKFNFKKYSWESLKDLGIPYDYSSIMHYGKNAFTMNGKPTILTKDPKMQDTIGQKNGLSFRDIKTVNVMYKCKNAHSGCAKTDSSCPGEGFVGKDCHCWCPGSPVQLCARGGANKDGGGEAVAKKKTKKKTAEKACEDQHKSCSYWSGTGECTKNPSYMLLYCKLSCKVCGKSAKATEKKKAQTLTTTNSCQDYHGSCRYFAGQGYCTYSYYVTFMMSNCKKSCNKCTASRNTPGHYHPGVMTARRCENKNHFCTDWAKKGECGKNPAYMREQCRKACGVCRTAAASSSNAVAYHPGRVNTGGVYNPYCRDLSSQCYNWARTGECAKNPAYMKGSCTKSCGLC